MEAKVTLDKVIAFLKIYLTFACCWPLSPNATKFQRIRHSTFQYFCCVNSIIYIVTALRTLFKYNDYMTLMKIGCEFCSVLQIPLQLILFAMQNKRLQFIVFEMEDYYQRAQEYEREIFQHYVDKFKPFYGIIICWLAITAISMMATPLFSSQSFPFTVEYPFDVYYQPLKTIILAHQMLTVYQSMTQVGANSFPALLLWFVAARFHILSIRFRTMTNMKELIKYAQEHYTLLRYAEEVGLAIRYIALLCVTFSIGAVIFGYLTFMSRQPWSVKWTFLMISFGGFIELYMYAWPADYVMSMSSEIAPAVYDTLWYNNDLTMRKHLINIILRSQHPVTISVPCALPSLSMKYYTSTSAMTRRAISNESFIFSEKQSSHLLPVLSTLQRKLENLNKSDLIDCHSLVEAIQQGLNKRFLTIFETKELIIAACLHPKFKLNWLTGEKRKRAENYLEDLLGIRSTENSSKAGKSDDHDDFFIFEQKTVQNESEQEELQRFLKSNNCNIEMLNDYPKLKKLFIKYNTALPSSASVERMFSIGGSVLTPQRGHLNDDTMEQQILLKINKEFR